KRRCEVPGERSAIFRSCFVGERGDHQLARQGVIAVLDPELPVNSFLPKSKLLAGDAVHNTRTEVQGGLDLLNLRLLRSPRKQVRQRQLDGVLFVQTINQFGDGGRRGNGGVIV